MDGRAQHTADVYLWRLRKYLGSYLAVAGDARAIVFTDTVGETVPLVRWAVCAGLEPFGVRIDAKKNEELSAWPADIAAADSAVRILVVDTGFGIPAEHQVHVFERFYRVEATRPRFGPPQGSGLGLPIAKSIVETHGGRIGVESQPGEGSTFWVELPVYREL